MACHAPYIPHHDANKHKANTIMCLNGLNVWSMIFISLLEYTPSIFI